MSNVGCKPRVSTHGLVAKCKFPIKAARQEELLHMQRVSAQQTADNFTTKFPILWRNSTPTPLNDGTDNRHNGFCREREWTIVDGSELVRGLSPGLADKQTDVLDKHAALFNRPRTYH